MSGGRKQSEAGSGFFVKKLVIVACVDWFAKCEKTHAAMRSISHWIGTVETNGDVAIFRGIDPTHLDEERKMVAEHNRRLDEYGSAAPDVARAVNTHEPATIEQARKPASAQRAGPSALFKPTEGMRK